jgi:hypothetical protein
MTVPDASFTVPNDANNIIASTGMTAGRAYYIAAGPTVTEANATSSATLPSPALCIAVSATECRKSGKWTTTGLTVGGVYYVPVGGGAITTTVPSASGNQIQRVGVASASTTLEIMPSIDVVGIN